MDNAAADHAPKSIPSLETGLAPSTPGLALFPPGSVAARLRRWSVRILPRKLELPRLWPWLEVGLVIAWALWSSRVYADLNITTWPSLGGDFANNIQLYFNWTWLFKCGLCVLWNGSINGGSPMLADVFTPILHPGLVLPVLLWGGINGAKITLVVSAIMAGLAQWWLGKVLGLGSVARLWMSFLAVISGHLWARMDYGTVAMTFSIAAASLFFAPMLDLALHGRRLMVVALGLMMASAVLSGQGYMQIGIVFGALPPMAVFLFNSRLRLRPVWRSIAVAALITILITALWWLPLALFWPYISKTTDPTFSLAQKNVVYSLLNLFINDDTFLHTAVLGKTASDGLYSNFISWVPIVFAIVGICRARGKDWRVIAYLLLAIWLIYLTSTTWIFAKLQPIAGDFFNGGRDPSLIAPLAVPLLLGLAGLGLDSLLKLRWPSISITTSAGASRGIGMRWLMLIPAVWALYSVQSVTTTWRIVGEIPDIYPIEQARTTTTEWVAAPDSFPFTPKSIYAGLKIILPTDRTALIWGKGRVPPPAYLVLTANPVDTSTAEYVGNALGFNILRYANNEYASVQQGDQQQACQSQAQAGNIDVVCDNAAAGVLTVYENNWTGWQATRDGQAVQLLPGNWLQADAPAGRHTYQFRYRPWDAGVGFILSVAGWGVIGLILWRKLRRRNGSRSLTGGDHSLAAAG